MEASRLHPAVCRVVEAVDCLVEDRDVAGAVQHLGSIDLDGLWAERREALDAVRGIEGTTSRPAHVIERPEALRIHRRNQFTCRYDRCGFAPTVDEEVLKLLGAMGVFTYYAPDRHPRWHPLAWTYMTAPEHLVPRSPDPDHWTTACWTCNYAKSDRPLHALGWVHDPEPPPHDWDGLRGSLPALRAVAYELDLQAHPTAARSSVSARGPKQPSALRQAAPADEDEIDLHGPEWEAFSFERSSIDAATRAADEDGLAADDPRRQGKQSATYGNRRGYSVSPIRRQAPQIYASRDGRWRMFNTMRHPDFRPTDRRKPWLLQHRRAENRPEASDDNE